MRKWRPMAPSPTSPEGAPDDHPRQVENGEIPPAASPTSVVCPPPSSSSTSTKEHIAVAEAQKLNIPTFAITDTTTDPSRVDFAIPANDDATKSIPYRDHGESHRAASPSA